MNQFVRRATLLQKYGTQVANKGIKNTQNIMNVVKPMFLINFTSRMALYARILQVFTRKVGTIKMQKMVAFKFKRFMFTFRPISKMKDQFNFRRKMESDNFQRIVDHMQGLIYREQMREFNLQALVKKNIKDKGK